MGVSQRDVASKPFYLSVSGLVTMSAMGKGQGTLSLVGGWGQRPRINSPQEKQALLAPHRDSGRWTKVQSLRLFSDEKIHLPLHKGGRGSPPVIASLCNRRGNLVEMIALFYMRLPHFTSLRSQWQALRIASWAEWQRGTIHGLLRTFLIVILEFA